MRAHLARFLRALAIYARGVAMGAADVVPGVSGGTIAFITGIYPRLIDSLTAVDLRSLRMLFRGDIAGLWQRFNAGFLLLLFAGILSAIFSLAHLIDYLLVAYPYLLWSVFFGLIGASAVTLFWREYVLQPATIICFLLGIALVLAISAMSMHALSPTLPMVYLVGVIAISAMLLPGLSGSFLLLLFGLYEPTLNAVKTLDGPYLGAFALGALTGLITFSHLISWLLKHYYARTLMFLIGLLFGSLYVVWPWRSMQGAPVWPTDLPPTAEPMTGAALTCMILAAAAVLLMEYLAGRFGANLEKAAQLETSQADGENS